MNLSEGEIKSIVAGNLPDFHPKAELQRLEGGNLNFVWRWRGKDQNIIIKITPPYIASNPEVPLSADRLDFEANALQLFEAKNLLHSLVSKRIRPPQVLFYDSRKHLLVMEDVGDLPNLAQVVKEKPEEFELGKKLGRFIARLHLKTHGDNDLADRFNNVDIQQTRLEVQYKSAAEYVKKVGIGDTERIEKKTKDLGQKLLGPGRCLIMGDLWPPSILVDERRLRLIDWEFCHFGRPLQDVGHFAAHCWMQAHTASSNKQKEAFKKIWERFWEQYQEDVGDDLEILFDHREMDDMATHIGAEILVRTVGSFKDGYVYETLGAPSSMIKEATQKATDLILMNGFSALWH